jgi:hypothetical protein
MKRIHGICVSENLFVPSSRFFSVSSVSGFFI